MGRTGTAISCACARRWKPMPSRPTEAEGWNVGTLEGVDHSPTFQVSIDPVGRSGAENMALDQWLLEQADQSGAAFLRLYRWDPPCLSLGRNEPAARRYDPPAGGEIVVGGRKLVGSAQLRQRTALLQHGSILLEGSQEIIGAISRPPSAFSGGGTTLAAVLGRPVSFEEVAEAVVRAWGDAVTATAPYRPLPPSTARFSDPAWTWRR